MMNNEMTMKLLELARENPTLPIIPIVDSEVCDSDAFSFYMAEINGVSIDEFVISKSDNHIIYKDGTYGEGEMCETVADMLYDNDVDLLPEDDDEIMKLYKSLDWTKAIIISVVAPS